MSRDELEAILTQARRLSPDELTQLIERATDLLAQSRTSAPQIPRYVTLFGSGKGSFNTREEADQYIRRERDAWGE
jgi:hypothetical protein